MSDPHLAETGSAAPDGRGIGELFVVIRVGAVLPVRPLRGTLVPRAARPRLARGWSEGLGSSFARDAA